MLVATAVVLGLSALRPAAPDTTDVVVAAHDLSAGALLDQTDVRVVRWPVGQEPSGVLRTAEQATGRRITGPLRSGEPLTDVRLAAPGSLAEAAGDDHLAVPVRLADASLGSLLQPGAVVDVIAADGHGAARVVAQAVEVLSVPPAPPSSDGFDGVLVVLSVPPPTATALAGAAAVGPLSVALRG